MNTIIYFTGFMGSGKTMIGRNIAERYGVPFYDLDELITEKEQLSIKEIFQKFGEPYFRVLETAVLRSVATSYEPCILALGGGAFCNDYNQKLIKESGTSIFLDVSTSLLVKRVMRNNRRPLLLNADGSMKSESEITEIITSMMRVRRPWYEQADKTIFIDADYEKQEVCDLVYEQLQSTL
jgi:shikimate kinase